MRPDSLTINEIGPAIAVAMAVRVANNNPFFLHSESSETLTHLRERELIHN